MSSSQHIALRAAVAALLAADPAVAGGRIFENCAFTLAEGVDSQVHVNLYESRPDTSEVFSSHPIDWDTDIEIRIKGRKAGSDEADIVVDAIFQLAYARVMSAAIAGVQSVTPGAIDWDYDEADTSVAGLTAIFTLRHRTTANAIT